MEVFKNQKSHKSVFVLDPSEVWHLALALENRQAEVAVDKNAIGDVRNGAYQLMRTFQIRLDELRKEEGAF
jgi:hypothetical protein